MQGTYMWSNPSVKETEGLTAGGHRLRNTVLDGTHPFFKHLDNILDDSEKGIYRISSI